MIKALPKEMLEIITANDALQRYLDNLLEGKEPTPRSWLFETKDPYQVLDDWLVILSQLEKGDNFEKEVFQFDTSQTEKYGPQGGVAPISKLMDEVVLPTFGETLSSPAFQTKIWKQAGRSVVEYLKTHYHIRSIRPATYQHVIDDMRARDTLESNSGWPDFARRNLPDVKSAAIQQASSGQWEHYPAIALFRNYNMKTRLVWMFPMSENIVESTVEQPWFNALVKSQCPFFAPWQGFDAVRRIVTSLYDEGRYLYATDFSSTDAHFRVSTTYQVLEAYESLLSQEAYASAQQSLTRMHHIPLLVGPDEMVVGEHGLASGSVWTNFIETLFDYLFGAFCEFSHTATKAQGACEPHAEYAIGDDMTWSTTEFNDALAEYFADKAKQVGQLINAEKVSCSPDKVKTLQRLFQRGYRRPDKQLRGVYSTVRALRSSIFPERFHKPKLWSSDMFCARQYMILENCVDHPLFEEFVKFVVRGQKDLIPFAKQSGRVLDKILRATKLLPGFNPTYNQERRDTSLSAFRSIAIAKSL